MTRDFPATITRVLPGLLISLPVLMLLATIQFSPSVPAKEVLNEVDIQTIEQLIVDNAPSRIGSADQRTLHLNSDELNLLADFALQTIPGLGRFSANVTLSREGATVDLAAPWKTPLLPLYLNIHARLSGEGTQPVLSRVRIGYLPIPAPLVAYAFGIAQRQLSASYVNYQALTELQSSVQEIAFEEGAVQITLNWQPQLLNQVQAQAEQLFLSPEDQIRILHYYSLIADIVAELPEETRSISLNLLLFPLFNNARERVVSGADVIAENRTLLQALSLYVNGSDLNEVSRDSTHEQPRPRQFNVTIQGRGDLAQHFTTSAAMTAAVGADLAGVLFTSKEAHDARYRTGFSFSDLTANIAGVAFGDTATGNDTEAHRLQERVSIAKLETDYMPVVTRDNAGITEEKFAELYQDRTSPAYLERIAHIDEQIALLPIYGSMQ